MILNIIKEYNREYKIGCFRQVIKVANILTFKEKVEVMITHSRLLEALAFDPETGIFNWKEPNKHAIHLKGKEAGSMNDRGYVRIKLLGKEYKAHRLAWFYVYGEWPDMIDHINRDRGDNRISNLRLSTPSLNAFNKTPHKLSSSGVRGVFKHGRRWVAYAGRNARERVSTTTKDAAVIARSLLLKARGIEGETGNC